MIRFILSFILLAMMCEENFAQSDSIYIWPGRVPNAAKPKSPPIAVTLDDGSTRVVEVTNPLLAVFPAQQSRKNGKAVLVCPGGGYIRLAIHKEGYSTAQWLSGLGYTVFVLHYRVPNQRDGALQDIQRSLRLIRHRAREYQIDSANITAIGFSAGAHLVARAAMDPGTSSYPIQDKADELSERPGNMILIYPAYLNAPDSDTLAPELDNETKINTFVFQTMDDTYVRSAFALANALRGTQAKLELHILPKGGHGYGMTSGNLAAETWPVLAADWLKRQ